MAASARQRAEKRSRIIDAAVEVFALKGFRSARIADIASIASVADGTIYLYFKNKDDLLLTIFEEKMQGILEAMHARLGDTVDPIERLRLFARFHFEQLHTDPSLAQVLQVELRQSKRFFRDYKPKKLWEYLLVIEDIIREGQARGVFAPQVDPFLFKWSFFGALDETSLQWVLARKRERFNLDRAADQVADVFIRGVVARGPAPGHERSGSVPSQQNDPTRRST